uniref:ATP synthase F0 subunit 8 n=1 Tax=Euseius sacchari TaxID=3061191 RepID=A0AAU6PCM9_9ACAR
MPQMKPMNWIYLMFIILFTNFMFLCYFSFPTNCQNINLYTDINNCHKYTNNLKW